MNYIYPSAMLIDVSGTAGSILDAFHTEIHSLSVNGKSHFANMSDPRIPAALSPALEGVVSLNDFRPHPMYQRRADYTTSSGDHLVVPADLATIYDFNPLFAAGYTGTGQTIVTVEDSDTYDNTPSGCNSTTCTGNTDWNTFRSTFGLSSYTSGSFTQVHPAPGATDGAGTLILASTPMMAKRQSMWSGPARRRPTRRLSWHRARTPAPSADSSRCKICSANPAPRLRL